MTRSSLHVHRAEDLLVEVPAARADANTDVSSQRNQDARHRESHWHHAEANSKGSRQYTGKNKK